MFEKRVFFLGGGALTVFERSNGGLAEPMVFRADEDGLTRFSLYLDKDPDTTVYVLVDFVEEEFREETLPHVLAGDRRALVANKKNRLFRDSMYSHAIFQGRESEGRRDDKVLFTCLIRPDLLRPWMAQMARRSVPVAGIYSLPIFSEALLKKLSSASTHALLVTTQRGGGLRQTFFHQNRLKISRLAVMQQVDARAQASYILGEVEKVRRYLGSLRLLLRDAELDVFVLSHGQVLSDLRQQAVNDITTRHHLLDVADVAGETGLKSLLHAPYSDQIFAHLLMQKSPRNHYATATETRYFQLNRTRAAMYAGSAVVLLCGLGWSGIQLAQGVMAREEANSIAQRAAGSEERYRLSKEDFPPAPADATNIKLAVEAVEKLKEDRTSPVDMMVVLSRGLDRFPNLQIDQIQWFARADAGPRTGDGQPARASRLPELSQEDGEGSGAPYQLARITGRVERFAGDYRAAMDQVGRFVDVMREQEGVEEVRVLRLPLNLSSEEALSGTAGAEVAAGTAEFEVQIMLRAQPA